MVLYFALLVGSILCNLLYYIMLYYYIIFMAPKVQSFILISIYFIVYYKIRHEAKTAYSQNTIKSLITYNIIKSDALHKI